MRGCLVDGTGVLSRRQKRLVFPRYLRRLDEGRDGTPFDNTTLFYETIATERGRRHMSTFPLVRALCNVFQLAGYRAEMEDGGGIRFDTMMPESGSRDRRRTAESRRTVRSARTQTNMGWGTSFVGPRRERGMSTSSRSSGQEGRRRIRLVEFRTSALDVGWFCVIQL